MNEFLRGLLGESLSKLMLVTIVLAGASRCSSPPDIETRLPPSPTTQAPMQDPTAEPRDKLRGAAIVYSRSGGIAGIAEQWSFYLDGLVTDIDGSEYQVPAEDVESLLNKIVAYEFFGWDGGRRSLDLCADCFTYSITVSFEGITNQITFVDGQADVSPDIWEIVSMIHGIVNSVSH